VTAPTHILDGGGTRAKAGVTSIGQLIIAPFAYDTPEFRELNIINTAFSFFSPRVGGQFVISGMRIKAGRFVSNTVDATIIIYEAPSKTSLTEDKILFEEALIRGESATLLPINILVNEGKFINAKTDDATIFINIFGYYIPRLT